MKPMQFEVGDLSRPLTKDFETRVNQAVTSFMGGLDDLLIDENGAAPIGCNFSSSLDPAEWGA